MTLRVAIAGVGNCANALIQGITFYRDAADEDSIPGLMHTRFGPYAVRDIEFVAAFDVDAAKVGSELADAMWASENKTFRFAEVAPTGVQVLSAGDLTSALSPLADRPRFLHPAQIGNQFGTDQVSQLRHQVGRIESHRRAREGKIRSGRSQGHGSTSKVKYAPIPC